jgi:CDP-glycerol glycerophosphotransferase
MIRNIVKRVKRKLLNKNEQQLKNLSIVQKGQAITIVGKLSNDNYHAKELWLCFRNQDWSLKVAESAPSSYFTFSFQLEDILSKLPEIERASFDFFVKVSVDEKLLSEKTREKLEKKSELVSNNSGGFNLKYDLRLGRFQNSDINGLETYTVDNKRVLVYVTEKGNLSLAINPPQKLRLHQVKTTKNNMQISGKLFTQGSLIVEGKALLKGRELNTEIEASVSIEHNLEETKKKFGLNQYNYIINLDFNSIYENGILEEDVYDIFLKLKFRDIEEEQLFRVGHPSFRAWYFSKEAYGYKGDTVSIINPYYTFKAHNLSLEVFHFEKENYFYLKKLLRWAWLLRKLNKKKDIWIVGERTYKAQDTGYHFFRYMREKHPDKNVFYVVDKESPERRNVEPYGNVLYFKSKEHIKNTLMATRVISSHHPDYLYPVRTPKFKRKMKALKVFLQHGVMGTKNMVANYGKNALGFNTDIFLVSSDFEKNMIVNDFGYDPKEVFVTGLSRFDQLLNNDTAVKRQLIIIPTWRDWIINSDYFLESEYFQRYSELIHHQALHELAAKYNFEIIFCLHPNMQKFTPYFKDAPIKVVSQGEIDVQTLLKESAMMITDYSSVGFDFSFLHKPIIYYQFDRQRFIGPRPSHLDLDNDLPGDIVFDVDNLLNYVEENAKNDFQMKEKYKIRANKFLKYRDQNSSERIFNLINSKFPEKTIMEKLSDKEIVKAFLRKFRKSSYYFPAMKVFYAVARRVLPVDKKLILFESSIGKQYGDSPKNIYEELLKQDNGYKYVWVNNGNIRFNDPNTKKIERLSIAYYFYLAKAGYWVNNQNFPTYITKRPQTTYIQTWHGTPLKKMLFDIETIQGRTDDYLERVYKATQNWDYLISPSEYATKAFRSAFRYTGEVLETGYPRNDIFYQNDIEDMAIKVKKQLNLPKGKKVILYAPTFRDNQTEKSNKFVFDVNMDLERLKETLGNEYILLLRMHVVISNELTIPEELEDFVFNVSDYPDIQDLYLISDILMTDYSSVMFDFANTRRPILYYTYDLEDYRDNIRGFYIDFEEEAPGPFLKDTEDIIEAIKHIDQLVIKYQDKYDSFHHKYCGLEDGHASKRVITKVFK